MGCVFLASAFYVHIGTYINTGYVDCNDVTIRCPLRIEPTCISNHLGYQWHLPHLVFIVCYFSSEFTILSDVSFETPCISKIIFEKILVACRYTCYEDFERMRQSPQIFAKLHFLHQFLSIGSNVISRPWKIFNFSKFYCTWGRNWLDSTFHWKTVNIFYDLSKNTRIF